MHTPDHADSPERIAADIAAVASVSAVPGLLRMICDYTGMGFAAVARVTAGTWTACAVQDNINFGLEVGGQLDIETTLCSRSREMQIPIAFDQASTDPVYRDHVTPRTYGLESYVSVPILRRDGSYFGNLCAIDPNPKTVANERTLSMFTLFADLISAQLESEDRHQATEIALSNERAAAELREQFIAVLGHDLRNPLSSIVYAAELLMRNIAEPEGVRVGQRLQTTTRRMTGLLSDVMDFARGRLGSGLGVTLRAESNLAKAVDEVVQELQDSNPGRLIIKRIDVDGTVFCDQGRIQQLVSNLLGNAVTHGATDQPVVVDAFRDGDRLFISVINAGAPIPPESLEKVFEPYWRPPESLPGGGLGLGLFICSQIVKAHGGVIEATSSGGSGTRFAVSLPVHPSVL